MAIYLSAGHNLAGAATKQDPGAIGVGGRQENNEAIKLRDKILGVLATKYPKYKVIKDADTETLAQYLQRIKPGSGSVVLELHFDAFNGKATGSTCLIGNDADKYDKDFAKELVDTTSSILKVANRGVKSESQSARGRLGLMRNQGIVALLEVCFIDNKSDMEKYDASIDKLANDIAVILAKFDDKLT